MAGIVNLAQNTMHLSWLAHAAMFCVGYFGQDLSHYITGEKTFQSSYQEQKWELLVYMHLCKHSAQRIMVVDMMCLRCPCYGHVCVYACVCMYVRICFRACCFFTMLVRILVIYILKVICVDYMCVCVCIYICVYIYIYIYIYVHIHVCIYHTCSSCSDFISLHFALCWAHLLPHMYTHTSCVYTYILCAHMHIYTHVCSNTHTMLNNKFSFCRDFISLLVEHTYYLIPLVFDSALPNHMDRYNVYCFKPRIPTKSVLPVCDAQSWKEAMSCLELSDHTGSKKFCLPYCFFLPLSTWSILHGH